MAHVRVLGIDIAQQIFHIVLEHLATDYPDLPVIVLNATNDLEMAVRCMQSGAVNYLMKPVETNRLVASVQLALEVAPCGLKRSL